MKEEEEKEEEEGDLGKRKPGGGDICDGGGRRVVAETKCRRRRRQGRRRTGRKGKDRDARVLLILVLLSDKGGDVAVNEDAEQGLVVSWWVVGNCTMLIGRGRGCCSTPSSSLLSASLQAPAAAGAACLLLLIRSNGLLSSISMGWGDRGWEGRRRTHTRAQQHERRSDDDDAVRARWGAFGVSV